MARYRITLITASVLLLVCSAPQPLEAWVSGRSKKNPQSVLYKTPFKARWVARLKKSFFKYKRTEYAGPASDGESVYVGVASGYFYAFRVKDGKKLWRVKVDGPVSSVPAVGFGMVYFGDDNGVFYALDKNTGDEIWRYKTASPIISKPTVDQRRVYMVTLDGTLIAVDALNGNEIWVDPYKSRVTEMSLYGHSAPLLADGILYIGYSDGQLAAIKASDGGQLWSRNLSGGKSKLVDINMQPLVASDAIYVATFAGNLYKLNQKDGSTIWKAPIGSAVGFALSGERLFVSGADGAEYALDTGDGQSLWKHQTPKGALSRPVVYGELVAVASSAESVIFLDAMNGHEVAHRFAQKNVTSDPILTGKDGNMLVYLSNGGRLYALELKEHFRYLNKVPKEISEPDERPPYSQ